MALARPVVGERHPRFALCRVGLASVLHARGELGEAEAHYRQAESTVREALGEKHMFVTLARVKPATGWSSLGSADLSGGPARQPALRPAPDHRAEPLLRHALSVFERVLGEDHWRVAEARSELGGCLLELERWQEA